MQQSGGGRRLLTSRTARPGATVDPQRMRRRRGGEGRGRADCRGTGQKSLVTHIHGGRSWRCLRRMPMLEYREYTYKVADISGHGPMTTLRADVWCSIYFPP